METRQIKFRAWDNEKKQYFKPTYEAYKGNLEDLHISFSGELLLRTINSIKHESLFKNRFILEQWTGLKDKNGTECYDGDIVSHDSYGRGYVEWDNDTASFMVWFGDSREDSDWNFSPGVIKECEIVSTIHPNPELLK